MKIEDFDKMVEEFLQPLDDANSTERWDSDWSQAADTMSKLRKHLFKADLDRYERYEQYLKLRAEFCPD